MAGRTHLQQALPTRFGLKCAIWAQPLITHVQRLDALRPRVELVEFRRRGRHAGLARRQGHRGHGGARRGTGPRCARSHPGMSAATASRKRLRFLGLICGSLAKLATDIILLAQTEVGEVAEPYVAGRGSSSTMPQKRNPIASEYILAAARTVHALVPVMLGAMAADHERATGPWQAELLALPQAFVLTHGALQHARRDRRGHGGRCRAHAAQSWHDARADRVRGGDDGPGAASRPRRGAPRGEACVRRRAGGGHQPRRRAVARSDRCRARSIVRRSNR